VPGIYDPALADEDIGVSTEEAHELTRRLAQDGLFVGYLEWRQSWRARFASPATRRTRSSSVVFCDGGEKYLSERFWDEDATPSAGARNGSGAAIRAHGAETYPNECCGALYGRDGVVTANVGALEYHRRGPRRRFLVRPQDYVAAGTTRVGTWRELLGFYHSHPDHPARPSQYDLDHAWPFFSYIIVSVRAGKPEAMTSWRLREDRSAFDPERLTYAEHN
jgi:proteasome lid subunit RPN8/RPN11